MAMPQWEMCSLDLEKDEDEVRNRLEEFMRKSGQTPEKLIPKIKENTHLDKWVYACREGEADDPEGVIGVGNVFPNEGDWYSCTLQKIFVEEEFRGAGVGSRIVDELVDKADELVNKNTDEPDCQILTADIDRTNVESRTLFERKGFKITDSFCMGEGEGKADVVRVTLPRAEVGPCFSKEIEREVEGERVTAV